MIFPSHVLPALVLLNLFRTMTARSLFLALALTGTASVHAGNWPNWRGPNQDGSSEEKNLPAKFSKTEGVKWAAALPGLSASVPAVWGDSVFVTAPIYAEQKFVGMCLDAKTGAIRWSKPLAEGTKWDKSSNLASPSPVTDGERVMFFFATGDLACFDFSGKELWKRQLAKDHGNFATQWTYSSSPVLDGGKLYIQVLQRNEAFEFQGVKKGVEGSPNDSYILAIDPATGKELWKVVRPSDAMSETREAFSTPVFTTYNGKRQMLVTGGDIISGHDAATGQELWRWGNWNPDQNKNLRLVPSAVAGEGVAVVCSPKKRPVFGVKMGLTGKLDDSALAWTSDPKEFSSDVSTPLFYQGHLYVLSSDYKKISCVDIKTGKVFWTGDLGSKAKFEASPTAGDGKIYMTNFWGEVYVVSASPDKFELLNVADMGDGSKAQGNDGSVRCSIPIANGCLYIRAQDKLYCVGR
jgi:outer membrane protein assembly factor BamB